MKQIKNQKQINTNAHICTLDYKIQRRIEQQLLQCGFFEDDIKLALNSRIRDLEDCIDTMEVFA